MKDDLESGNAQANSRTTSDITSRKTWELKPLKHVNKTRITSSPFDLTNSPAATKKRGSHSLKQIDKGSESLLSNVRAHFAREGTNERKGPAEGSSYAHQGNMSPGDPVGVKDVANVVVKYLSPHLKQGLIVSKVINPSVIYGSTKKLVTDNEMDEKFPVHSCENEEDNSCGYTIPFTLR